MKKNRGPGQCGATLVELMVAIIVTSLIMLTMSTLFHAVIKMWVESAAEAEMIQTARGAMMRMSEDITCAMPPVEEKTSTGNIPRFHGRSAPTLSNSVSPEVFFFAAIYSSREEQTTSPVVGGTDRAGDISNLGYWLKMPAGEDSRIQYGKEGGSTVDPMPRASVYSPSGGQPFAYYVDALDFAYQDVAGTWYDDWASWPGVTGGAYDDSNLPNLVRVTATMKDPSGKVPNRLYSILSYPVAGRNVRSLFQKPSSW